MEPTPALVGDLENIKNSKDHCVQQRKKLVGRCEPEDDQLVYVTNSLHGKNLSPDWRDEVAPFTMERYLGSTPAQLNCH